MALSYVRMYEIPMVKQYGLNKMKSNNEIVNTKNLNERISGNPYHIWLASG